MSESWGKTGRVTLRTWPTESDADAEVVVDGVLLGDAWRITYGESAGLWFGRTTHTDPESWEASDDLPDRDAAVMWVLRRTAPDVWRAERPVVWRVARGEERFPVARWHVHNPDTDDRSGYTVLCGPDHVDSDPTWHLAFPLALRLARDEYARAAR